MNEVTEYDLTHVVADELSAAIDTMAELLQARPHEHQREVAWDLDHLIRIRDHYAAWVAQHQQEQVDEAEA